MRVSQRSIICYIQCLVIPLFVAIPVLVFNNASNASEAPLSIPATAIERDPAFLLSVPNLMAMIRSNEDVALIDIRPSEELIIELKSVSHSMKRIS